MVTIISYCILDSNAQSVMDQLTDDDFYKTKAALYDMQEATCNLMSDSQKLNDMQREYLLGRLDYAYVQQALNELKKSKSKWFSKVINYLSATDEFEPTDIVYPKLYPANPYNTIDLNGLDGTRTVVI